MEAPLTFGIELEFALAYIPDHTGHSDPKETRQLHFPPSDEEVSYYNDEVALKSHYGFDNSDAPQKFFNKTTRGWAIRRHISESLNAAGIPAYPKPRTYENTTDLTKWQVADDRSVRGPVESEYEWLDVELISPTYEFTQQKTETVLKVCKIVTSTYLTYNGETSGLHIHIGRGDAGFKFRFLRDFLRFIWAFEPQIDTLHPPYRRNGQYGTAMRDTSLLSLDWFSRYGKTPSAMEGVAAIGRERNIPSILTLTAEKYDPKDGVYNLGGLLSLVFKHPPGSFKPTIKFRQHRGTLQGDEVIAWLHTLKGIITWITNAHALHLGALLDVAKHEKWQRMGDGYDAEREREMGPTLAEYGFTVIDLFKHMELYEAANYYKNKLYRHDRELRHVAEEQVRFVDGTRTSRVQVVPYHTTWDHHLQQYWKRDSGNAMFKHKEKMRRNWESLRQIQITVGEVGSEESGFDLDLDDKIWPGHLTKQVRITPKPVFEDANTYNDEGGEQEDGAGRGDDTESEDPPDSPPWDLAFLVR